jgi:hypothetical protein
VRCTNLRRCCDVVKIKWTGVNKKDVQLDMRSRSFAYRDPDKERPNTIGYAALVALMDFERERTY